MSGELFEGVGASASTPKERELRVTVYGRPIPRGSKHGFALKNKAGSYTGAVAMKDSGGKKGSDWMKQVRQVVGEAVLSSGWELVRGPVEVSISFFLARPKGHFGTGRNAGKIKASAPPYPVTRPDFDKLTRAVADGLQGSVYSDDSVVTDAAIRKRYGTPERVEIVVREISGEPEEPYSAEVEF